MTDAEVPEVEVRAPASHETTVLRIITPDATPEEVAALVAVFSALGGGEADKPKPRSEWGNPARMHRRPLLPGAGGWRTSSLP